MDEGRSTGSAREAKDAVSRARQAQPAWAARPLAERVAALKRAAKGILRARRDFLALMEADTGKIETEALLSEVAGPLDQVSQWARVFRRHSGRERVRVSPLNFPGKRVWVDLEPRGVVGAITPWNYPLGVFFRPVLPALLAGNGVVVKPSEYAPRVAQAFVDHVNAELPDGLLSAVHGDGETGQRLIEAGIDACTFTGSVAAGRDVGRRCAARHIPLSAELGGNDAAVVLADCDLERTLAGVTHWALHNAGQNCGAIERLVIEEPIADEFVHRLGGAWERLRVGPLPASQADVSPLANRPQLDVVERHVADALERGAVLVAGGRRAGNGLGYRPTLLDRCTEEMAVVREETFGPVLPVLRVANAEEAIAAANRSEYGLGGSVWTADLDRGAALARRLECGVASVNNHAVSGALVSAPWTGVKHSGPGVANSRHALSTFLRPRTLLVDGSRKPDVFWTPFDADLTSLGHRVCELQLGRFGGLFGLPKLAARRVRAIRAFFAN